ncbi:MAG: CBS domain-containing protein [Alphaproteobacteria bacterium]|nr:CBS domain-containing protein [Alphaproteobacteria bacterium]
MSDSTQEDIDHLLRGQVQNLSQIMRRDILTCSPETKVAEAAGRMVESRCSSIVVVENDRPEGIWTEHDALLIDLDDGHALDLPIREVMSKPVRTIRQDVTIEAATLRFRDEGLRHYVVVDDKDQLVGVVSQSDVVRQQDVRHFLSMRSVSTVIRRSTLILQASSTLAQAASRLHNHGGDCAVVIWGDGRRGIVTERDLLKAVASRKSGLRVGDVAHSPIMAVPQTVSVLEARETMERKGIRHLGVTDGEGVPVGLLSFADILSSVEFSILRYVEEMLEERSRALNQAQNRLRGSLEELNRTNEELEQFIHGVSTGCRPPLARLAGSLDRIQGGDAEAFSLARADVAQMQKFLDGIADYARLGQLGEPGQSVELDLEIAQVMVDLAGLIRDKGAKIKIEGSLPRIKGDPAMIRTLFTALFDNALRPVCADRKPEIRLSAEREQGRWLISLHDNGPGIDPARAESLFGLFQAAGAGVETPGVGLAIARRIVERHGGRIWVETIPGQGNVMRMTLFEAGAI